MRTQRTADARIPELEKKWAELLSDVRVTERNIELMKGNLSHNRNLFRNRERTGKTADISRLRSLMAEQEETLTRLQTAADEKSQEISAIAAEIEEIKQGCALI